MTTSWPMSSPRRRTGEASSAAWRMSSIVRIARPLTDDPLIARSERPARIAYVVGILIPFSMGFAQD